MYRTQLLTLLFVLIASIARSNDIDIVNQPNWITKVPFSQEITNKDNGGYQYLLLDFQDNLLEQSMYRHYVIAIHNSEGIQDMSNIEISYDPSYQQLDFHSIRIIRNGRSIEKLKKSEIKVFQRETNHERSLYDGSFTAVVNLTDVREADIIEYSYTVNGFNPIKQGNYSRMLYHQYSIAIEHIHHRIIASNKRPLYYKLLAGAEKPEIQQTSKQTEYTWDISKPELILYDDNSPSWYEAGKRISMSTYKNWEEVIESAIPLYLITESDIDKISLPEFKAESKEDKILDLIDLVQEDIRYLGIESGIGAYKPNQPSKVYLQRYGDCKDKSLLLVALLREEGIEAHPLLVNTQLEHKVEERMPGYSAFNHCIVKFQYQGKDYFIDPTISSQGGSLDSLSFPRYKKGLLLKPGETALTTIPYSGISTLNIEEDLYLQSIGGSAKFTVKSEYIGRKADGIRSYYQSASKESIQKEYLEYYSSLYPSIRLASDIKIVDEEKTNSNRILVEETYEIDNFWEDSDDGSYVYCTAYPLVLESEIDYPDSPQRSMPYYTGEPFSLSQLTRLHMPESWNVEETEKTIEGDAYRYHTETYYSESTVYFSHEYELTKNYILADSVPSFLASHDQINGELTLYLTYQDISGFKISMGAVLLAILILGAGTLLAVRIYRRYNPEGSPGLNEIPIGSWLVLPAIGFAISPFIILYQLLDESYFNQNTWTGLLNAGENEMGLLLLGGFEFLYNLLLLVLIILILLLFFKRRTSAPKVITFYLALAFVVSVIDLVWVEIVAPGLLPEENRLELYTAIGKSLFQAAIWIPVFNISLRVKETFTKKYIKA